MNIQGALKIQNGMCGELLLCLAICNILIPKLTILRPVGEILPDGYDTVKYWYQEADVAAALAWLATPGSRCLNGASRPSPSHLECIALLEGTSELYREPLLWRHGAA